MRVLNIMLGRHRGGIEQAAVDYCAALAHAGHDVTAVLCAGAAVRPAIDALGVRVVDIGFAREWNPLARRRMQRAFDRADVAIVHGNRAGKLTRGVNPSVPVVAVAHSRFFKMEKHFRAVIALSKKMAAERTGDVLVHLVPNLVRVPQDMTRLDFRPRPVVAAMGRFSHEKGLDVFIDAVKILRARGVPFDARIGGGGRGEKELHKQAAGAGIDFTGWVSDKTSFFAATDIYCMSSRTESFPLTLLEAMAHGVPCVATRCGGPSEIIDDGVTGYLCDIDAEALAHTLQSAIEDAPRTEALGRAGRQKALTEYDLPVVAEKLDTVLRALVTA
jgi:glycosyltransferase involved in cell wall biosynthesis